MMTDVPRAIPRPSERRRPLVDRGAVEPQVIDNAQKTSGWTSFATVGWVAGLSTAVLFGMLGLSGREDSSLGIVLVPIVLVAAWVIIGRFVSEGHGASFGALVFAGLGVRLLASVPRLIGGADSPVYQREGVRIASSLRSLQFDVATGRSIPGTGAVRYFTGVVNVFTGSTYIATFLVFAILAFIGQVVFLLGVRSSLNTAQFRVLSIVVMFSPTLAFWPSSIGKESLALFGIGFGVFGASRLYDRRWSGVGPVLLGFFAVGMVRPHVAMVLLAGLLIGLFARRAHTRGRVATHAALLVVVVVGSMWMAGASADLFGLDSLEGISDVSAALDFAQERTSQDEARFVAARVSSVADYPWAAVTVLFRPFPWEAPNAFAMISALESIFLALLLLRAVPGFVTHGRQLVQRGQLLYAVAFVLVFIFLFSAIGNFGILSRQRAQVIPFVLLIAAFGLGAERRGSFARAKP
ncbi:MAG: hypothetical protein R8J94_12320 [Acidimicrobiia bacterium]|nr:hypothetical protein [Acidimicrobiia bacterium]